jgi:antitoxin CptB
MADETRLKRLKIRSWRRGTKEMDLILGPFCDAEAAALPEGDLDLYEALLSENDHDLYSWVCRCPRPTASRPSRPLART